MTYEVYRIFYGRKLPKAPRPRRLARCQQLIKQRIRHNKPMTRRQFLNSRSVGALKETLVEDDCVSHCRLDALAERAVRRRTSTTDVAVHEASPLLREPFASRAQS